MLESLRGRAEVAWDDGQVKSNLHAGDMVMRGETVRLPDGASGELVFFEGGVVGLSGPAELVVGLDGESVALGAGRITVFTPLRTRFVAEVGGDHVSLLPGTMATIERLESGRREVEVHLGMALVERDGFPLYVGPDMLAWAEGGRWTVLSVVLAEDLHGPKGIRSIRWIDQTEFGWGCGPRGCRAPVWDDIWASETWANCSSLLGSCHCSYVYDPANTPPPPTFQGAVVADGGLADDKDGSRRLSRRMPADQLGDRSSDAKPAAAERNRHSSSIAKPASYTAPERDYQAGRAHGGAPSGPSYGEFSHTGDRTRSPTSRRGRTK